MSNRAGTTHKSKPYKNNTSGHVNIYRASKECKSRPWVARVTQHNVNHTKSFETIEEAIKWRDETKLRLKKEADNAGK